MEKYTLNYSELNQELNDKLIDKKYVIRKITFYLNKEVDDIDDIVIYFSSYYLEYFIDTLEYFNNKISFNCDIMLPLFFQLKEKMSRKYDYFIIKKEQKIIEYKSIEVDICKPNIYIWKFNNVCEVEQNYVSINSNYFETLDELINYIMDISGMNYELSKKYLIMYSSDFSYNIDNSNYDIKENILFIGNSIMDDGNDNE